MDVPTRRDLVDLIHRAQGDCVSIFLPTHREKEEAQQDPIRLKNLLHHAEVDLLARGHRATAVRDLLEPARARLNQPDFWSASEAGLAVFLATDFFRFFHTPISLDELAVVGRAFQITPLVPLLNGGEFYVLAVSQKHVELLWGNRFSEHVVRVEGLPHELVNALNFQPPDRMLQAHLFVRGPGGVRLKGLHGQGGASDFAKEEVSEYFRMIDKALHPYLRDKKLPMVFAGVDYLFPLYRECNKYPHLQEVHILGNPDQSSDRQLHEQAWEILRPRFEAAVDESLRHAGQLAETDGSICDLAAILPAAHAGRVASLFIARGAQRLGTYRAESDELHVGEKPTVETEDLLNRAAIETLTHGGDVQVCDQEQLPRHGVVAALYRYGAMEQEGQHAAPADHSHGRRE
jgi:hypothetical protein